MCTVNGVRTRPGGPTSQAAIPSSARAVSDFDEDRITTDQKAIDGPKIFILTLGCCIVLTRFVVLPILARLSSGHLAWW